MTPAEELAAAADKLDARTTKVVDGPWRDMQMGSEGSIVLAGGNTVSTSRRVAMTREFAEAEYIAAMNPLVGKALAANLRAYQVAVERHWRTFHEMWRIEQRIRMMDDQMPGLVQALDLARLINGSKP